MSSLTQGQRGVVLLCACPPNVILTAAPFTCKTIWVCMVNYMATPSPLQPTCSFIRDPKAKEGMRLNEQSPNL